ncbi:MAG TPA: hypothetical protein VFQ53_19120 [Kofleriaceae bacterium]|nr:hypothetical protein [Kofleriaceae bacterium]
MSFLVLLAARAKATPSPLPEARVEGATVRSLDVRRRTTWIAVVVTVVGFALAWWSYQHDLRMLYVRDGGGDRYVEQEMVSSLPALEGVRWEGSTERSDVVVVNLSSGPVRVESVQYGNLFGLGSEPHVIPPNTMSGFYKIDHIGPGDRPPHEVTVQKVGNLAYEFRYWLTWGAE